MVLFIRIKFHSNQHSLLLMAELVTRYNVMIVCIQDFVYLAGNESLAKSPNLAVNGHV